MRIGIIGTGAIAHKHAQAWRNLGFSVSACSNRDAVRGRNFADQWVDGGAARFIPDWRDLIADARVDLVDLCTLPGFRLPVIEACAAAGKPVQVQKPIAANTAAASRMIEAARGAGIALGVVSQHRFDDSSRFLKQAILDGRLGRILQADAYIKWFRPDSYYARPGKGTWAEEGGGALINQGIHSVDLLLWIAGTIEFVEAIWQLGAAHTIEAEDVVNALVRYESGATGVIQAATAFRPGYPERIEIHGTKGSAAIAGDRLVAWDVEYDFGDPAPVQAAGAAGAAHGSGASDPAAISLAPFERQFRDFTDAIRAGRAPLVSDVEGYRALAVVEAIYRSCFEQRRVAPKAAWNA